LSSGIFRQKILFHISISFTYAYRHIHIYCLLKMLNPVLLQALLTLWKVGLFQINPERRMDAPVQYRPKQYYQPRYINVMREDDEKSTTAARIFPNEQVHRRTTYTHTPHKHEHRHAKGPPRIRLTRPFYDGELEEFAVRAELKDLDWELQEGKGVVKPPRDVKLQHRKEVYEELMRLRGGAGEAAAQMILAAARVRSREAPVNTLVENTSSDILMRDKSLRDKAVAASMAVTAAALFMTLPPSSDVPPTMLIANGGPY